MIKIKISKAGKNFQSLEVKGHANSDAYGHDIVCAGVSAVVLGGLNNIQDVKNFEFKVQEGHVLVKAKKKISAHDEVVIETIICGLKTIQEENNDFIKIKAE